MKVWNKRLMNTSRKAERREVEEAEGAGPSSSVSDQSERRTARLRSSADFNPGLAIRLSGNTTRWEELKD